MVNLDGSGAEPQWSPPLNGGSTPAACRLSTSSIVPQWSPPSNGGNTTPPQIWELQEGLPQ